MAGEYDLGIDLGTTFTAAAVRPARGPVRVVPLDRDGVQVPSVLLLEADGGLLVGARAEERAPGAPERVVREFKRRFGDDTPIVVGGEAFPADRAAAEMVRWTADQVAWHQGRASRRLAVSHPAGWGAYRRRLFGEALVEVGLPGVVLVAEPEAAALAHAAAGRIPPGRTVAVYDLGGGTFDAAVVRGLPPDARGPGVAVLGRGQGLETLGGIDFDEALFWHVCGELGGAVAALDPAEPATLHAVARLRRACVAAKETLSVDTEAVVAVELPGVRTRIRVTRGEFEDMIEPALRQTVDVLGEVLDSARVRPADLDGLLLVGGSSRIPLVARVLSQEIGRPVAVDPDPTTVVARGAALAAGGAPAPGAARTPGPMRGPGRTRGGPWEDAPTGIVAGLGADPVTDTLARPARDRPVAGDDLGPEDDDGAPTTTLRTAADALRAVPARPPVRVDPPLEPLEERRRPRRLLLVVGIGIALLVLAAVATLVPVIHSTSAAPAAQAFVPTPAVPAPGVPAAVPPTPTGSATRSTPATTPRATTPRPTTRRPTTTAAPAAPVAPAPAAVAPAAVAPAAAAPAPAAPPAPPVEDDAEPPAAPPDAAGETSAETAP